MSLLNILPPVNLALLICDELPSEFNHGTTAQIYERWLNSAYPPNVQPRLNMTAYDVREDKEEYPTSDELKILDALMITGSRNVLSTSRIDLVLTQLSGADAFGDEHWIRRLVCFTQHIYNKHLHIRIFGICFGHQIISRALGGTVQRNEKWEYGLNPVRVTHFGKEIFGVERLFELQQIHQDHVPLDTLSDHFSTGSIYLLGSSPRTPNQGFVQLYEHCRECELQGKVHEIHQHIHIMTLQGHPEFTDSIVTGLVRKWVRSGRLPDPTAKAYFGEGNTAPHLLEKSDPEPIWPYAYDGIHVVGRAFWKVFGVKYADDDDESDTSPEDAQFN